jgi:hypothetical protein
MHRSGTSAITRLVNLLGIPLCVSHDLMLGYDDNPDGHWESVSLAGYNERLLHLLFSTWAFPPSTEEPPVGEVLEEQVSIGRQQFRAVHTTPYWAWKDPRLCVLLPFWRRALAGPHAAIMAIRHPAEVAASLARRDGLLAPHVFAMWERYLRLALRGSEGMPVLVLDYSELLEDPAGTCAEIRWFLEDCGLHPDGSVTGAAGFIRPELRHHVQTLDHLNELSDEQRQLLHLMRSLKGPHLRFARVELPRESPETGELIDGERRAWSLENHVPAP